MRKEAAHTRIRRETQDVARKMNKLLRHERPRWRMESVTPRALDLSCYFRLDQRENLPEDQCHDLSSKPAARGVEIGTQDHTATATSQPTRTYYIMKKEAARTRSYRETQDVVPKLNTLLRNERPHLRMESVTPRGLHVTCHFRLDQRENLPVDQSQNLSSKPTAHGVEIGTHDHTHTHTEAKRNRKRIRMQMRCQQYQTRTQARTNHHER